MSPRARLPLGMVLAACAAPSLAEELETATAPTTEISAYRAPVLLRETTQGVTLVTREEIDARNPTSVMEVLESVPGVQVDQAGSPGGYANIYIRGSDPETVLVLIDGVRVNDPMLSRGGAYDLSSIDPSTIERIEVLRGAGSALYGADAMGGVVNIVTRRATEPGVHGTAHGGIGGNGYGQYGASLWGGTETIQLSLNGSKLEDGETEDGGTLDLGTVNGRLSIRPADWMSLDLYARHTERESTSFPESSGGIDQAVLRELEEREARETTLGAQLKLQPWERVGFNLQFTHYNRDEEIDTPGVAPGLGNPFGLPPTVSETDFDRDTAAASVAFKLPLDSDLVVGYEYMWEAGNNESVRFFPFPVPGDFELERKTYSLFGELISRPVEGLVIQLGLREDDPSGLSAETTGSAGVRYTFARSGTSVKARYAEGYRPPSFFALSDPIVGNPDLVPETSSGWEFGFEQPLLDQRVDLMFSVFDTRYSNLVDFDPVLFQLVNRDAASAAGFELGATVRPTKRLAIGFNYTRVDAELEGSNERLRNRPQDKASLSIDYRISDPLSLRWTTVYVGDVIDFSVPTGDQELSDYSRSDVSLAYTFRWLTVTAAVDNVFDERYEQFIGFENPGRRARLSLSARF